MRGAALIAAVCLFVMGGPAMAAHDSRGCPATTDAAHPLNFVNFFDGEPKDLVEQAPEDLSKVPKLDLIWRFDPKRTRPLVLLCTYKGKPDQVRVELAPDIMTCRLTGAINSKGEVQGASNLVCADKE